MIPADTVQVARGIYPKGDNLSIKMRDELGSIFNDEQYRELLGQRGKPAESPGRLALVTLLQFAEDSEGQNQIGWCGRDWYHNR